MFVDALRQVRGREGEAMAVGLELIRQSARQIAVEGDSIGLPTDPCHGLGT